MLQINQLKVYIDELSNPNKSGRVNEEELDLINTRLAKMLHISKSSINNVIIKKKSIDARKGKRIAYSYTLFLDVNASLADMRRLKKYNIDLPDNHAFEPVIASYSGASPVIIGAGPAGLFCGYILALNGAKPIIIEQGSAIEERTLQVNEFWNDTSKLNPYSNVSFGEGGAGTFSDGKLNTSVKDPSGRIDYVKKTFVNMGAPEEIAYLSKPHIGTDELRKVIINLRNKIIEAGGTVMFNTCMTDISINDNEVTGIDVFDTITGEKSHIKCDKLVLAIGHSARNTYKMLSNKVYMEQKDFAIGVRVEHPQDYIGHIQYGDKYTMLPSADYKLRYHASNDRAVYSFCMCPGGYVVNASTEHGMSVTNGMSNHNRDSGNANSAIVVNITKNDFESDDVLAGVEFQRKWESLAYEIGQGEVPAQRFADFAASIVSADDCLRDVTSVRGRHRAANIREALPDYVSNAITEAMYHFDNQMPGFAADDVMLYGVETRTSAPVRIVRDEYGQSDVRGIFPCGEGAGYAGGIMSAAVDGIKVAHMIVNN